MKELLAAGVGGEEIPSYVGIEEEILIWPHILC